MCIVLSSCRERTPGVPRKKTWADAVRSVDGETLYYRKNYTINCFNQCNKCPSNARFVIFFTSTVADAARRHGLRIACGCVPRRERSLRRSSSPKKVTPRLCCSLVNALATRRLATNFFRYQAVGCCALSFPLAGNAVRVSLRLHAAFNVFASPLFLRILQICRRLR